MLQLWGRALNANLLSVDCLGPHNDSSAGSTVYCVVSKSVESNIKMLSQRFEDAGISRIHSEVEVLCIQVV